jgi:hypothetical protein
MFTPYSRPTYTSVAVQVDPPSPPPPKTDKINFDMPLNIEEVSCIVSELRVWPVVIYQSSKRERSLSPMDLDSPTSTPPQSPIISPKITLRSVSTHLETSAAHSGQSSGPPVDIRPPPLNPVRTPLRKGTISSTDLPPATRVAQSSVSAPRRSPRPRPLRLSTDNIHTFANGRTNGDLSQLSVKVKKEKPNEKLTLQTSSDVGGGSTSKPTTQRNLTRPNNPFVSGGFVADFVGGSGGQTSLPLGKQDRLSLGSVPAVAVSSCLTFL